MAFLLSEIRDIESGLEADAPEAGVEAAADQVLLDDLLERSAACRALRVAVLAV